MLIYWKCPSFVKDALSGESEPKSVESKPEKHTNKQPILNGCVVRSIDTPRSVPGSVTGNSVTARFDGPADLCRLPICYPNVSHDHVKGAMRGT